VWQQLGRRDYSSQLRDWLGDGASRTLLAEFEISSSRAGIMQRQNVHNNRPEGMDPESVHPDRLVCVLRSPCEQVMTAVALARKQEKLQIALEGARRQIERLQIEANSMRGSLTKEDLEGVSLDADNTLFSEPPGATPAQRRVALALSRKLDELRLAQQSAERELQDLATQADALRKSARREMHNLASRADALLRRGDLDAAMELLKKL